MFITPRTKPSLLTRIKRFFSKEKPAPIIDFREPQLHEDIAVKSFSKVLRPTELNPELNPSVSAVSDNRLLIKPSKKSNPVSNPVPTIPRKRATNTVITNRNTESASESYSVFIPIPEVSPPSYNHSHDSTSPTHGTSDHFHSSTTDHDSHSCDSNNSSVSDSSSCSDSSDF